jgi:hypothetical protein
VIENDSESNCVRRLRNNDVIVSPLKNRLQSIEGGASCLLAWAGRDEADKVSPTDRRCDSWAITQKFSQKSWETHQVQTYSNARTFTDDADGHGRHAICRGRRAKGRERLIPHVGEVEWNLSLGHHEATRRAAGLQPRAAREGWPRPCYQVWILRKLRSRRCSRRIPKDEIITKWTNI